MAKWQIKDLTGQRFGRLVARERIPGKDNIPSQWICDCDCGNTHIVRTNNLKSGSVQSCGCLQKETARNLLVKYDGHVCSTVGCEERPVCNGLCLTHSNEQYHEKNRYKLCRRHKERRVAYKLDTMSHYSGGGKPVCAMCGFDDPRALVIDHINDDGAEHRREISGKNRSSSGVETYRWLMKNNYPIGFQVLCANCNTIKEHERKEREAKYG